MNSWINTINSEIRRLKVMTQKKFENIYNVKYRKKKIIKDLWNLPKINEHSVGLNVGGQLNNESYFKLKSGNKTDK